MMNCDNLSDGSDLQESEGVTEDLKSKDLEHGHIAATTSGVKSNVLGEIVGMVVPSLSLEGGKKKSTFKRSLLVIMCLYMSHTLSSWGDRMWGFAVSLLLALLYPGSLLLPGIHGFVVQLTVAIFGTIVGDWVDFHSRIKVIIASLLVENGLLAVCSIALAMMFYYNLNVCLNVLMFGILSVVVILLASGANLATVANTISIEKDWIVVLADGNKDTLAVLNSNMRRIDLICKLLAPALTGVLLQYSGPFTTTVIVALWNIVSFFGELGLLWIVYKLVPTLAVKKFRGSKNVDKTVIAPETDQEHPLEEDANTEDEALITEDDSDEDNNDHIKDESRQVEKGIRSCSKLLSFFFTFKDGWKIYIRQEVALVGFSIASLYLTVLGFSGVTASYFLTQGVRSDLIGLFQGLGAIFGVIGTIIYPFLRKKFGTVRTGLYGISTQLCILLFCIASITVPSNRVSSQSSGYYSADCAKYSSNGDVNKSVPVMITHSMVHPSGTEKPISILPTPTMSYATHTTSLPQMIDILPSPTPTVDNYPFPMRVMSSSMHETMVVTSHGVASPQPSATNTPNSVIPISAHGDHQPPVSSALILILCGIIGCRIGLWVFDLSVQQLLQERVREEERGVVSGVVNAMISIMDMLHYVLVIAAPRPEHFRILTAISFSMVFLGWLLYSFYVRKSRGHFFHFSDYYNRLRQKQGLVVVPLTEENIEADH